MACAVGGCGDVVRLEKYRLDSAVSIAHRSTVVAGILSDATLLVADTRGNEKSA